MIACIGDVDIAVPVGGKTERLIELLCLGTDLSPGGHGLSVQTELLQSGGSRFQDVKETGGRNGNSGGSVEFSGLSAGFT